MFFILNQICNDYTIAKIIDITKRIEPKKRKSDKEPEEEKINEDNLKNVINKIIDQKYL